ncbi:hypothetical protein OSB04_027345 [Centaurea solstitialis]|uniref:BHLH domain-containing protein n=1 Tax=Centaurea solstitialis TaxID=347529 RepID=A0AA38SDD3_9ASTR|nr:hypothetical protein OSB04_027345 [Centaurea solstitialis]
MANMFDDIPPADNCCSSSPPQPPATSDDISLFLRQILLKSSSSSSSFATKQLQCDLQQPLYSIPDRLPTTTTTTGGGAYIMPVPYVSSSSIDNDLDEYDCESEVLFPFFVSSFLFLHLRHDGFQEGFENLMEEMAAKSNPPSRNPSKRTRAAERRRSRINEKMKALQKLIPNSNKTDKASMLDEAIEYLKQLQLRVQMLTMRNGINMGSMSGVVQPHHHIPNSTTSFNEPANMTPLNQEMHMNPMISLPIQCSDRSQPSIPDLSRIINPGPSSRRESSFSTQHGSFDFQNPPTEFCREGVFGSNSLASEMGVKASNQGRQESEGR